MNTNDAVIDGDRASTVSSKRRKLMFDFSVEDFNKWTFIILRWRMVSDRFSIHYAELALPS